MNSRGGWEEGKADWYSYRFLYAHLIRGRFHRFPANRTTKRCTVHVLGELNTYCLHVVSYPQPEAPGSVWILLRRWWALQGSWPRRCTAEACCCPVRHTSTSVLHTHTHTQPHLSINAELNRLTPFSIYQDLSGVNRFPQSPLWPFLDGFYIPALFMNFSSPDGLLLLIHHLLQLFTI